MAIPDGYWTANLEATKDRMNQMLLQFDAAGNRPAAASGQKGMVFVATDTLLISYDNGGAWVNLGTFSLPSQVEAEAGTATTERVWTAQRVKQAIDALGADAIIQANQTELEGESNVNKYAPPDLIKHSPGVAKGWCRINTDGTILGSVNYPDSYNIASITDTGTGIRVIVWATDFSQAGYSCVSIVAQHSDDYMRHGVFAVGSVQTRIMDISTLGNVDHESSSVAFGDQ
jgi:hypothetical protein